MAGADAAWPTGAILGAWPNARTNDWTADDATIDWRASAAIRESSDDASDDWPDDWPDDGWLHGAVSSILVYVS